MLRSFGLPVFYKGKAKQRRNAFALRDVLTKYLGKTGDQNLLRFGCFYPFKGSYKLVKMKTSNEHWFFPTHISPPNKNLLPSTLAKRKHHCEATLKNRPKSFGRFLLKFRVARCSREGDNIANIIYPRGVHHKPFKAEAVTRVGHSAKLAQFGVPPIIFFI